MSSINRQMLVLSMNLRRMSTVSTVELEYGNNTFPAEKTPTSAKLNIDDIYKNEGGEKTNQFREKRSQSIIAQSFKMIHLPNSDKTDEKEKMDSPTAKKSFVEMIKHMHLLSMASVSIDKSSARTESSSCVNTNRNSCKKVDYVCTVVENENSSIPNTQHQLSTNDYLDKVPYPKLPNKARIPINVDAFNH